MTARSQLCCLVLSVPILLAGCGGGGAAPLDLSDPASFKSQIEHPFFPMVPGTTWLYEGIDEGQERYEEVRVLAEPRVVWGIPCTGLREEQYLDGVLAEVTTEWFAEDRDGNLWKFGEEGIEFDGPTFEQTPDSWMAGEGDAFPWMMLSATPSVGERYVGYRPDGLDVMLVRSLTSVAVVPAGTFVDCLEILENPEDVEDQDIILYAAGTGRVHESSAGGHVDLVAVRSD